jgi:hypothetical protein
MSKLVNHFSVFNNVILPVTSLEVQGSPQEMSSDITGSLPSTYRHWWFLLVGNDRQILVAALCEGLLMMNNFTVNVHDNIDSPDLYF